MKTMEQAMRIKKIRDAKEILKEEGYFVDNLWSIHDVLEYELSDGSNPNLTDKEAHWVLDKVLCSEWITEQVFVCIGEHIELLTDKNK